MDLQRMWITRTFLAGAISSSLLAGAAGAGELSAAEFASNVWTQALDGNAAEALALISELPADDASLASIRDLQAMSKMRAQHLSEADAARLARLDEAREEMRTAMEEGDLPTALGFAVEMNTLARAEAKAAVLNEPEVRALLARAEVAARDAEDANDWLESQSLYYRMNLLFEQDARYKADVERVGHRLMALRLYTPERLYEMRNDQRKRDGEDELPPFNSIGESWNERLSGISQDMVVRSLNTAHSEHVDDADMAEMLIGGLEALRTIVTTEALVKAFPTLANAENRGRFLKAIDDETARLRTRVGRAGFFELRRALNGIMQVNNRTIRLPESVLLHEFGNGAMGELDPFSAIIWPDEIRRFERTTMGKFTGVGIQIQMDDATQIVVVTPLEGTPAQRAGIRKGDIIREVDGEATLGISLSQAVDRITGAKGTHVTLGVERKGEEDLLQYDIVRDEIPIFSVKGWRRTGARENDWDWFIDRENKIGYIRLSQFTEQTTREMVGAVQSMKADGGVNGLILDLRFNPGGLLSEAVNISNLFVSNGVIVSQHDAAGIMREAQRARPNMALLQDLPVALLINEGSASASEIVAGCLQDYGKAILIGDRSFGKGSVQNVYPLARGAAALKLTTQYYRLPNGRLIHRREGAREWGVEPDVVVSMTPQQINDSIVLRMDADVMPTDENGHADGEGEIVNPDRLITEGIDLQLETALLLMRTQTLPRTTEHARIDEPLIRTGS